VEDIQIEHNEMYEDELIRLVSSNSDTLSQYVIFRNTNDELFALNVTRIEELIQNKNLTISKGLNHNTIISGVAKIRNNMVTLIDFDKWLNPDNTSNEDTHKLIILCHYANQRIGIIVKDVVGIHGINAKDMYLSSQTDDKTAYIAELSLNKKVLCNIFDSDRLILDVFPDMIINDNMDSSHKPHTRQTDKMILLAEDNKLVQHSLADLLIKLKYNYEIYPNGKLLIDRLEQIDSNEVCLIISDIEMPIMDGIEMLEYIHKDSKYNNIPIIVNTNMINDSVTEHVTEIGAVAIVEKLDFKLLESLIQKYYLR